MRTDPTTLSTLRPAIEAARVVLRRRDKDEVPAALARVAASSARTLPPPLASTLLTALDEDADLRAKALEEVGHGPEVTAARAFLSRPEGWEEIVDEAVGAAGGKVEEREVERLRADLDRSNRRVEAERGKVADLRRQVDGLRADLGAAAAARASAVDAATGASAAALASAEARLGALESEVSVLRDERDHLARRLDLARADARDRRRRFEPPPAADPTGGWVADPHGLARHIDDVFAAAKAKIADPGRRVTSTSTEGADPEPLTLPPGIRPDAAEAVDAVAGWAAHVYVDGYNLAGALGAVLEEPSSAREVVREAVDRLRAVATATVSIVFDSAEGEGDRPGEAYVVDADEELRRLAAEDPRRTVVISDDREVIEGVDGAGATALWSRALVDWLRR